MGWSISCILVNEREKGYFGLFPQFNHDLAQDVISKLGFGPIRKSSIVSLEIGLSSRKGWFAVGAYEGAVILSGLPEMFGCGEMPSNKILTRVVDVFPTAKVLAIELASVTNYFGFSLYERHKLVRGFAGDADRGIVLDVGEKQPEEAEIISKSNNVDWRDCGESLVFAMSARFFGLPLDQYDAEKLAVEILKCSRKGVLFNLVKGRNLNLTH